MTDGRKRRMMTAAAAAAALAMSACIAALLLRGGAKAPEERLRTVQTIPDAEQVESPESKKEAYRRGQERIDGYWESLPADDRTKDGEKAAETHAEPALSYDDITSGTRGNGRQREVPQERTIRDDPQRQAILKAMAEQQGQGGDSTATEEEALERMEGLKVQVRRSEVISSLDEDVHEDLGTGFSSLEDRQFVSADEGRPYRCMFCRDEKVRSGQRVSVRLLEDMVVGGTLVPKNTRISAVCTIGRRMDVAISTIEINSRLHAVSLDGYDTDGTKGIYCSDLVESTRKLRSQGITTTSSILSGRSMAGLARDAANVGLAIAQSAGGETTVSIPAGYVFYLVEKKGHE